MKRHFTTSRVAFSLLALITLFAAQHLSAQSQNLPYAIDFESSNGSTDGWAASGTSGMWEWGSPSGSGPGSAHSGSRCWGTRLNGNYGQDNVNAYLDSPSFDMTGSTAPEISFYHYFYTEGNYDGGCMSISVNNGSFNTISTGDPGVTASGYSSTFYSGAGVGFSGSPATSWALIKINPFQLTSASVTSSSTIRIRFWFSTDSSVNGYPGWYIDTFSIGEPTITVSQTSLDLGSTFVPTPGTPQSYTVSGGLLAQPIAIQAPSGAEISQSMSGPYGSSLSLTATNGTVAQTTIYARSIGQSSGMISGNITHTSTGATSKNVALTGTVELADFDFTDFSATTPLDVYLGSTDNLAHSFTVAYPTGPANTLTSIELTASGSGDDASGYAALHLYEDTNLDGLFTSGTDTLIDTQAFTQNDGTLTFTLSGAPSMFTVGTTRGFLVIADMSLTANDGETFSVAVTDAGGGLAGTNYTNLPLPAAGTAGLSVLGNALSIAINGPASAMIDNNDSGQVLLDFSMSTANDAWTVSSITFGASGTMDDSTAFTSLSLYVDSNDNGTFESGTDVAASPNSGNFTQDNGMMEVLLSNTGYASLTTTRFLVVADFSGTGVAGQSVALRVESVIATPPQGGVEVGIPSADGGTFTIAGSRFDVTLNGPGMPETVNSNVLAQVMLDFSLSGVNDQWTVTSVTFTASGTGDDASDYAELALYEDSDGSGAFEFANDSLATATVGAGFSSDDGTYVASLTNSVVPGSGRRFFFVVSLAGTAAAGETFACNLSSVVANSVGGGSPNGVPTASVPGLVIDSTLLAVQNDPAAPASSVRLRDESGPELLSAFRLTAVNGQITVGSISITAAGSADWAGTLDSSNGVEVWRDSGNGAFDGAGSDTLLYSTGGTTPTINAVFSPSLSLANSEVATLFVVLNFVPGAGTSIPMTYSARIAADTDVSITGGAAVSFGAPAPNGNTLTLVDYFVTSVSPLSSVPDGGGAITIKGSGFTGPASLLIGGAICPGTAIVNSEGTEITGLMVPPGILGTYDIQLVTSLMGARTLSSEFTYRIPKESSGGGGGCALITRDQSGVTLLFAMLLLGGLAWLRKREA